MEKQGISNIVMVHDLAGHQFTQTLKKLKYLHNMQSIIAAQMTAVLQLTDIRAAKMMKDFLSHRNFRMRQMLSDKAMSEHTEAICKVGPFEMI